MRDICIVYSGDLGNPGGGTDRVSAFAKGLSAHGHDVCLVIARPTGSLPDRIRHLDTEVIPLQPKGVTNQLQRAALLVRRAKAVADERGATLQITHSPLAGMFALANCSDFVVDMHDLAFSSPLYQELPMSELFQRGLEGIERRGVRSAADVVVVSDRLREFLTDEWAVPRDRISVIPNGYFGEIQQRYFKTYPERVPGRVVFLGMVHPKVDVDMFERIAELPEVSELIVVGDGPNDEKLRRSDAPDLSFTGRLPDAVAFDVVSRAGLAINPQHRSALQEASSPVKLYLYAGLGLPVVATAGPDVVSELSRRDALTDIEPGDSDAFVRAVKELMGDEPKRRRMADNAYEASERYRWSARAERLAEVYSE
jgi:glycosyltransferase involved in cell wall biosynthesis